MIGYGIRSNGKWYGHSDAQCGKLGGMGEVGGMIYVYGSVVSDVARRSWQVRRYAIG